MRVTARGCSRACPSRRASPRRSGRRLRSAAAPPGSRGRTACRRTSSARPRGSFDTSKASSCSELDHHAPRAATVSAMQRRLGALAAAAGEGAFDHVEVLAAAPRRAAPAGTTACPAPGRPGRPCGRRRIVAEEAAARGPLAGQDARRAAGCRCRRPAVRGRRSRRSKGGRRSGRGGSRSSSL